jgi:hypothetical protein
MSNSKLTVTNYYLVSTYQKIKKTNILQTILSIKTNKQQEWFTSFYAMLSLVKREIASSPSPERQVHNIGYCFECGQQNFRRIQLVLTVSCTTHRSFEKVGAIIESTKPT